MTQSPVYQILRTLPPASLRALDKFIASPYHVTHAGVPALYQYLRAHLADASEPALQKETIAAQLGETPERIYHLTSYLLEAVEQFLALETWRQQSRESHALVVEALRRLHLDDLSAGMLRYARKRLQADPYRGSAYHRADFTLHLEAYHLSQQQGRAKAFNLQELSAAQDVAFVCEKLRTGCMLLSHQAVSKQAYDKGLLNPVLQYLEGHPYLDIPSVAAYYHGFYAQSGGTGSDAHFRRLKTILEQHTAQFSVGEVHDLYLMAINFCIRRINQSEEPYFRDAFDLYRSGLQHGALLEDGALSRWTYTNIAMTGLKLREFDWVFRFLNDYAPLLPEIHREGALNFNLARYYYDTGNYRQAMQHLVRMEYDDVLQNLVAKTLLCKIYYELDEYDALENHLDSIEIYLRRKKVLGYHKENYTAFVRLMRKLLARDGNNTTQYNAVLQQIEATPGLTERDWFLKQLAR